MKSYTPNTFSIVSLGCPKNLVDSEIYVQRLKDESLEFRLDVDGCERVVLNTCGFLQSARDEARQYVEALIELKNEGRIGRIEIRGCMPQFEGIDALSEEFPEVDQWFGVPVETLSTRYLLTEKHVAYLRIADGCDRRCTFCAIPSIRGRFRSVPMETLLAEARILAKRGVKELVVIAQETTFWGTDLYGKPRLVELLRELEAIDGLEWIRLMYSYPLFFDDELIDLFAAKGKLLPYIDMPLQHADDAILKRMSRRVTRSETETLLGKLRERIDGLVLRTSLIAGFPGETDAMFEDLLQFVERWKFERAGVFAFSAERGTPAAGFPDQVPVRVIERRYDRLYNVCEKYSTAWAVRQKGTILPVRIDGNFVDESGRKEARLFLGRTYADAPDIDPIIYVTGDRLPSGALVECEILENEGCDLVGIVAG